MRDAQSGLESISQGVAGHEPTAPAISELIQWLERDERICTQQRHSKNKLCVLHVPEVECIGKGKARKPYEFGVKVSLAVTHRHGLLAGARSFPGNLYAGQTLSEQLEQTNNRLQDIGVVPTTAARGAVRRRLQHPLAAAGDPRRGAGGPFFDLLATGAMHVPKIS